MDHNILLRVEKLSAGYKSHKIIDNISLDIEKGKIYSVIGPNGCGKTTLIRTITRNLKPLQGKIFLDGNDIFTMKSKMLAKKMAVLFQSNDSMSDLTVKNLVEYGRFAYKKWWKGTTTEDIRVVDWAIKKTALQDLASRKINTLSGGERQKAWIATALAQTPELLILDEPTTYLDISHQLQVMELIERLNREEGITVIMVLHDINHAIRYSDEIVILKDGKILKKGSPNEVLSENTIEDVFKVESLIVRDISYDKPLFYAKESKEKYIVLKERS